MRDHHGQDLRGRSMVAEEMDGADFTRADLRGADLSQGGLAGADFTDARVGLRPLPLVGLFGSSLLIVAAAGFLIGSTLRGLQDGLDGDIWQETFGRALALVLVGLAFVFLLAFGFKRALVYTSIGFVVLLGINYLVIAMTSADFDFARDGRTVAILLVLGLAMLAGGVARAVGGVPASRAIIVVGLAGGFAAGRAGGGILGIVVSVLLLLLAKRALHGDERDRFARRLIDRIVTRWGTRFVAADLTDADFTGTRLAQCDLHGATLDGAKLDDIVGWPPLLDDS